MKSELSKHRVVIVGGGAGGLELATRLGDTLGKRGLADITLIDKHRTHVWKPKLHEIAAGSMDMSAHEVDYLAQAHWHHFRFRIGEMTGLDRTRREVHVAPYLDDEGRAAIARMCDELRDIAGRQEASGGEWQTLPRVNPDSRPVAE